MIKRVYFDVETSGLNPIKNAILQLAMIIEVDGHIVEQLNLFIKPFTTDVIDPEATKIHGLNPTEDKFMQPRMAYRKIVETLDKYINKYNPLDKAYLVGFNCQHFDKEFLSHFFIKNGSKYLFSYFYPETLDLFCLLGYACQGQRHKLGDGKLVTFCKALGLKVESDALHDAMYDTELVYNAYKIFEEEYPI